MTLKSIAVVFGVTAALVVVPVAPAFAHGGGVSDATNFRSSVNDVVERDASDEVTGPGAGVSTVTWRVLAGDALLQVTNTSGQELRVPGYDDEPYLRITADGVWENRNSPAVYLNNDRFAQTPVPEDVSAQAEPRWVKVGDGPTYAWHDHRIHWMAATPPAQVKAAPGREVVVYERWEVPFELAGEPLAVTGQLRWIPPVRGWPWVAAALGAATLALALVALMAPRSERGRVVVRLGGVIVGAVALLDLVHAVDDILAVPATLSENVLAFGQSAIFIALGVFGALKGWRGGEGSAAGLAVGAGSLTFGIGLTHLSTLTASQLATTLPPAFSRAVVAANLGLVAVLLVAGWRASQDTSEVAADVPGKQAPATEAVP